jgi:hypothetical protein
MDITTHRARIVGPVSYRADTGRQQTIPIGPCLLESDGGTSIAVIWGTRGQRSVSLPLDQVEAARAHGLLVILD